MGNGVERTGGCNPAADGAKHFQMFSPVYGPAPPVWFTRDLSGTNTRRVSCPLLSAIELNTYFAEILSVISCGAMSVLLWSAASPRELESVLDWNAFLMPGIMRLCAWLFVHLHLQGALNVSSLLFSSLHHRKARCRCRCRWGWGWRMGCVYVFGTRDLLGKRGLISCRMIYAISEPGPQSHTEMNLPAHAVFYGIRLQIATICLLFTV